MAITTDTHGRAKRFDPGQALLGAFIAVFVLVACAIGSSFVFTDPMDDGPPELRLRLQSGATMQDGLAFLADRLGSGDHVEKVTVEDRLVTVRFVSDGYAQAACALGNSPERNAVFRQEGVTFDIAAMCAFQTEPPRP